MGGLGFYSKAVSKNGLNGLNGLNGRHHPWITGINLGPLNGSKDALNSKLRVAIFFFPVYIVSLKTSYPAPLYLNIITLSSNRTPFSHFYFHCLMLLHFE